MRKNYLNTLEWIEREKVGVAGNEVSRMAAYGEFEEFVVFRIAASVYSNFHDDPFSLARQCREKTPDVFLINISPELSCGQNSVEFGECRE